jgi:phosphoglycolate phosphatase
MMTILFDIDGTLISTGGAGMKAIQETMREMFGIEQLPQMDVHGRTDCFIFRELFEHANIDFDHHFPKVSQRYWDLLPETLQRLPGRLLPGVGQLLEVLDDSPRVHLGLLTGNARKAAEIKLNHFGLGRYFRFGGFGDQHACRNDVAWKAIEAAQATLGPAFDRAQVWVIGDTIDDIRCGRAIGAKVIAVETGGSLPQELRHAGPDIQLSSLEQGFEQLARLFG